VHSAIVTDDASPAAPHSSYLRAARLFLVLLFAGDLVYLAIHVGHLTVPAFGAKHYSLEADRGLSEYYQYMKQLWLALCLAAAFVQRRHLALLCWSGFFGFLLLDDALQIHELGGHWLGRQLGLPAVFGLRPDDFGELLIAGGVGGALLGALALTLWRESGPVWRVSRELLLLTGLLAVFGVVVDMIHVIAYFRAPAFSTPLAFLEDGAELLIISALTAYALWIALQGRRPSEGLRTLLLGAFRQPRPTAGEA
jgi:hypothetical protein